VNASQWVHENQDLEQERGPERIDERGVVPQRDAAGIPSVSVVFDVLM
jgi:hypothetical protein